ncbi:hypothetical protein ACA910_007248 [Epithemia clementina (nom. ined.)]
MMDPVEATDVSFCSNSSNDSSSSSDKNKNKNNNTPSHHRVVELFEEDLTADANADPFDDEFRVQYNDDVERAQMETMQAEFSKEAHAWHNPVESRIISFTGRRKAKKICLASVIFSVVLFIILSVFGRHNDPKKYGPKMCGSITCSLYQGMVATLSQVTPQAVLTDSKTIQNKALQWLIDENQDYQNSVLQERYAIVVLHLSMNANVIQPNVPTCEWPGITCAQNHSVPAVTSLIWSNQGLTGTLPNEVAGLASFLEELDLGENKIGGSLPDGLFECKRLLKLFLHDNQFTGTLSDQFSELRHLTHLYLGLNQFEGPFPVGLGSPANSSSARSLTFLSLYKNKLSGSIPPNLHYRFMYYLDLSHNSFTGHLPLDWSEGPLQMFQMRHLFLNDNQFSGSIPDSYPSIGNGRMELFHAGNNQLTGTVPGNYNPQNLIESLEFQGNNFTALDPKVCELILFLPPSTELANLKLDCNVCTCDMWCEPGYCYP